MRHWNADNSSAHVRVPTAFLPYLWGIETHVAKPSYLHSPYFYPTYEALKRMAKTIQIGVENDFYPTYEALKLSCSLRNMLNIPIFTLPMRHWNKSLVSERAADLTIFTLPMRHWNSLDTIFTLTFASSFLPYLWGIETQYNQWVVEWRFGFLPYLWGIETVNSWCNQCYVRVHFYPTYEALKLDFVSPL